MFVKQSSEQIRREVLKEDAKKDVGIHLAVAIGIVAGISSLAGVNALILMRALVYFRHGVDIYWMTCVPFIFPGVTGLFAAYKKQFGLYSAHLTVTLLALLLGGLGFGPSIEPIFINRQLCQPATPRVSCDKPILSYLYVISGSLAALFAVIGFFLTVVALYLATHRIAKREYKAQQQLIRERRNTLRMSKIQRELRASLSVYSSQRKSNPYGYASQPALPSNPGPKVRLANPRTARGQGNDTRRL